MSSHPLVSVIVPTYNSEETIVPCLKSVTMQTYPNIEVIIVDSNSTDRTRESLKEFDVRFVPTEHGLLAARYVGLRKCRGRYILMLDSDQILGRTVVSRALMMMKQYDMLHLEENSYEPRTWLQRLFEADRRLVHRSVQEQSHPLKGVLLARFYRKDILKKAFEAIPKRAIHFVVAHDHAIIYYEAYRVSHKVGILPKAVWHIEPASLPKLWAKNYRYGKTAKGLAELGLYDNLLRAKHRFRKGSLTVGNLRCGLMSYMLLGLKGIAYQIGYWS